MSKLARQFLPGLFLGFTERSGEMIVGDVETGAVRAAPVRRLSPDERCDPAMLLGFVGVPWKPLRGQPGYEEG